MLNNINNNSTHVNYNLLFTRSGGTEYNPIQVNISGLNNGTILFFDTTATTFKSEYATHIEILKNIGDDNAAQIFYYLRPSHTQYTCHTIGFIYNHQIMYALNTAGTCNTIDISNNTVFIKFDGIESYTINIYSLYFT